MLKIISILITLSPYLSYAQADENDITGLWYNEDKTGKIRIFEKDNQFFGELTWVDLDPGDSGLDDNNPDQQMRSKPLVGLLILKGFEYDDGAYEDGTIYDPENGKTYSCTMKLEDINKLYVRGFIGFSLIGRTTYWTRVE